MSALYVVDTNVVIAGLITRSDQSPVVQVLQAMLTGGMRYLLSADLLAEYRAVMLRPAIADMHGLSAQEVDSLLEILAANGAHRQPRTVPEAPDPGDAQLLALLDCDRRAALITGDKRLRGWKPRYRILTPRERSSRPPEK